MIYVLVKHSTHARTVLVFSLSAPCAPCGELSKNFLPHPVRVREYFVLSNVRRHLHHSCTQNTLFSDVLYIIFFKANNYI